MKTVYVIGSGSTSLSVVGLKTVERKDTWDVRLDNIPENTDYTFKVIPHIILLYFPEKVKRHIYPNKFHK